MATSPLSQNFDVQGNKVVSLPTNTFSASSNEENASPNASPNTVAASPNLPVIVSVTTSQLAERYGVGDRSIQLWVKRLIEECGLEESALKENSGNQTIYTSYCVELLDALSSHRTEGGKIGQWFASLHSQPQESSLSSSFPVGKLAVSSSVEVVPVTSELSNLVSAEWQKRESTHQQGMQRIEDQFVGHAENRDRLTAFVDAVYGDRVEEIKTKSALKDKLEQVVAADQVIENLDDDLETLIRQVVPVKNG